MFEVENMKSVRNIKLFGLLILVLAAVLLAGCKQYDNFITFFNTYYNAEKLMKESIEEFEYQEEKKRVIPRVIVPDQKLQMDNPQLSGTPPFMQGFIISRTQRQPVSVKLDSIIIKGTKILTNHPKSNYVEGVLFLMARTYFYREEWLPSQIKCSELIDKFPDGDLSPDAHFLLSLNLIIQRKFFAGKIMLSRTVDIAWQKKRYDILSDAFRVEAELALYENDLPGALRPYLQAIAQSDDRAMKAKWQVELGSLLFRIGMFERAEREFAAALRFRPDYLAMFEANLYRAASLIRIEQFDEAESILNRLERDGKFQEWKAYVTAQRMQIARIKKDPEELKKWENFADSAYSSHPATSAFAYEYAMEKYFENDWEEARNYFAKARANRTPVFFQSEQMYILLNSWESYKKKTTPVLNRLSNDEVLSDTTLKLTANDLFELARVHTQLKNTDSALYYYELAAVVSPISDTLSAKYLYVLSHYLKDPDLQRSDSLLEVIVDRYPRTVYGRESMNILGYTQAFIQDTVLELYSSGRDLMRHGEYRFAIKQFTTLYNHYPHHQFAPRSLYNSGWIYERNLHLPDSALKYYLLLIEHYPNSPYAQDVRLSVDYMLALQSGEPLPDSLLERQNVVFQPKHIPLHAVPSMEDEQPKKLGEETFEDILKPRNLIRRATKMLSAPIEELKDLRNMDMQEIIMPKKDKDSTNVPLPEIEIEKEEIQENK